MNEIMEKEISKPSVTKRAFALFTALMYLSCLAPAAVHAESVSGIHGDVPAKNPAFAVSLISAEEGGEVRL